MTYPCITQETTYDAVIIGNGDFPRHPIAKAALTHARYICCCDGAGATLISHGLTPDAIVGDGDSLPEDFKKQYAGILHLVSEQDDNDQTKATRHCMALGMRHIAYVGMTGQREDHTLGNISLLCRYRSEMQARPVMITDHGYFIPAHGDNTFLTFEGQQVSIFNVSCSHLTGSGFKWCPYTYRRLWQGTLNEAQGDQVSIRADGDYLLFLTHDAKKRP